jgi:hypothetical protein
MDDGSYVRGKHHEVIHETMTAQTPNVANDVHALQHVCSMHAVVVRVAAAVATLDGAQETAKHCSCEFACVSVGVQCISCALHSNMKRQLESHWGHSEVRGTQLSNRCDV